MAYYVSVTDGSRKQLALGPFRTHGEALGQVAEVRVVVQDKDPRGCWYGYGTAHDRATHRAGVLNGRFGLPDPAYAPAGPMCENCGRPEGAHEWAEDRFGAESLRCAS